MMDYITLWHSACKGRAFELNSECVEGEPIMAADVYHKVDDDDPITCTTCHHHFKGWELDKPYLTPIKPKINQAP